jgi:DNA-3-methyladenine glycosylase I
MKAEDRCPWCGEDPLYVDYHDREWGNPVRDDRLLFEFLLLETFQAGLSWITILRKRENFRSAFDQFDYNRIAEYDEDKYEALLGDEGIIRNRLKIRAAIGNAAAFQRIRDDEGSFSDYLWSFVDHQPVLNHWNTMSEVPARTELSDRISKDLKKRGFKFVGSTVVYAFLQAVGLVNDHLTLCFKHPDS